MEKPLANEICTYNWSLAWLVIYNHCNMFIRV